MATAFSAPPAPPPQVSADEYLDLEAAAEKVGGRKREYAEGRVREMPGGSWQHSLIIGRVTKALNVRFSDGSFAAFPTELRVGVEEEGPFYYPDVAVAPVPPRVRRDRGETLAAYGRIGTVADYVLIAQDRVRVDHYSRQQDGSWRLVLLDDLEGTLRLSAIGVDLPLAEIYDGVFPATA